MDEVQVQKAIQEAMHTLHTAPHFLQCSTDDKSLAMSPLACMMLSLMIQWFIRYFCKCIIQILNPKALSIHNEILATYKRHDLTSQIHFCRKSLVKHYQVQLTLNNARYSTFIAYLLYIYIYITCRFPHVLDLMLGRLIIHVGIILVVIT